MRTCIDATMSCGMAGAGSRRGGAASRAPAPGQQYYWCVYIYIYTYTHMYIYIYTHICIYIYTYIWRGREREIHVPYRQRHGRQRPGRETATHCFSHHDCVQCYFSGTSLDGTPPACEKSPVSLITRL